MTNQDRSQAVSAEDAVEKIKEDKAAISDAQDDAEENRSTDADRTAEDSTTVDADARKPIDPEMPQMPPA